MNTVEQIYDQLVSIASTELGVNWQRLRKVFDPLQNDFRNIEQAYGIRHGAASPFVDATKVFVLSHRFDIILTDRAANRDSDLPIQEKLQTLYSKADDIFQTAVKDKLSLDFVTSVDGLTYQEPVVMDNGAILLTASIEVKYYIDPY